MLRKTSTLGTAIIIEAQVKIQIYIARLKGIDNSSLRAYYRPKLGLFPSFQFTPSRKSFLVYQGQPDKEDEYENFDRLLLSNRQH
jgi:hypothetical protein